MKRTILMLQGLALTGCSAGAPFVTRRQSIRPRKSEVSSSPMTVGGESADEQAAAAAPSCAGQATSFKLTTLDGCDLASLTQGGR